MTAPHFPDAGNAELFARLEALSLWLEALRARIDAAQTYRVEIDADADPFLEEEIERFLDTARAAVAYLEQRNSRMRNAA